MDNTIDLSVCLVTRSPADIGMAAALLRSLHDTADPVSFEAIVVDVSQKSGADAILGPFPRTIFYDNNARESLVQARNRALDIARGRYVSFWEPAAIFRPRCLKRLVDFMDDNPDVGLAGPKIMGPSGEALPSVRRFPTLLYLLFACTGLGWRYPDAAPVRTHLMRDWDHGSTREVDWLVGAGYLLRREVFEEIGRLDTSYSALYADLEYCRRARRAGWHIHYVHDAGIALRGSDRCLDGGRHGDALSDMVRYLTSGGIGGLVKGG